MEFLTLSALLLLLGGWTCALCMAWEQCAAGNVLNGIILGLMIPVGIGCICLCIATENWLTYGDFEL